MADRRALVITEPGIVTPPAVGPLAAARPRKACHG
jgi:hypothetical protein